MKAALGVLLLLATFPVGVLGYNAYVGYRMNKDLPKIDLDPATGIMKGAEPVFLEADGNRAILMIHGYIGSPTDFGRLPQLLHQAGFTVSAPLLPGHGRDPRDFSKTTSHELVHFAVEAYTDLKKSYDHVTLIGLSMGGALGVIVAANHIDDSVDRLILLAPYFRIKHHWYYLLPAEIHHKIASPFIPYVKRPGMFKQVYNKESLPYLVDYDFISTKGTTAALQVSEQAKQNFAKLSASESPILVIHSKKDKAADYKATHEIIEKLGRKDVRLVLLNRSNHLILWDYEAEIVEEEIMKFISEPEVRDEKTIV